MASVTVLIPDGDTSREVGFTADRWEQVPGPDPGTPPDPCAGRLDLFDGDGKVAWFLFGAWLGVWFTDRKEDRGRF